MSGPITDDPLRICPACGALYLEDRTMYFDPDRCPACGTPADYASRGVEPEVIGDAITL